MSESGLPLVADLEYALRTCPAQLAPGLTEAELARVETKFDFAFAPEHRLMLSIALPLDAEGRWPDWRSAPEEQLRARLAWPVEGLLFDVEHNGMWMPQWGARPGAQADALSAARQALQGAPKLVPLYSHRFLPSEPTQPGNPVLSVMQSDVIYYGQDLLDWFDREFHLGTTRSPVETTRRLPFWAWFLDDDE
jgi:hypothetical protein